MWSLALTHFSVGLVRRTFLRLREARARTLRAQPDVVRGAGPASSDRGVHLAAELVVQSLGPDDALHRLKGFPEPRPP